MKTSLEHLPLRKRRELERVVEILHEEFEQAHLSATTPARKKGRILKIILFGSYARGDWVDRHPRMPGHRSDYDILIIVNHPRLTDVTDYWELAEDRLLRDSRIKTLVNFIVHDLNEVNERLREGQYFFSDIKDQGIALYELPRHRLATFTPLDPADAHRIADKHFKQWFESAVGFYFGYQDALARGYLNISAFNLHQSVERFYTALLLVLTNYVPNTHNIKFLRSLTETIDSRLIAAWPRDTRRARAWFELLKRAYIEARYSEHYEITEEQLKFLAACVEDLRALTDQICQERLAYLAEEARKN